MSKLHLSQPMKGTLTVTVRHFINMKLDSSTTGNLFSCTGLPAQISRTCTNIYTTHLQPQGPFLLCFALVKPFFFFNLKWKRKLFNKKQ